MSQRRPGRGLQGGTNHEAAGGHDGPLQRVGLKGLHGLLDAVKQRPCAEGSAAVHVPQVLLRPPSQPLEGRDVVREAPVQQPRRKEPMCVTLATATEAPGPQTLRNPST